MNENILNEAVIREDLSKCLNEAVLKQKGIINGDFVPFYDKIKNEKMVEGINITKYAKFFDIDKLNHFKVGSKIYLKLKDDFSICSDRGIYALVCKSFDDGFKERVCDTAMNLDINEIPDRDVIENSIIDVKNFARHLYSDDNDYNEVMNSKDPIGHVLDKFVDKLIDIDSEYFTINGNNVTPFSLKRMKIVEGYDITKYVPYLDLNMIYHFKVGSKIYMKVGNVFTLSGNRGIYAIAGGLETYLADRIYKHATYYDFEIGIINETEIKRAIIDKDGLSKKIGVAGESLDKIVSEITKNDTEYFAML